jgi:hypothetical protein
VCQRKGGRQRWRHHECSVGGRLGVSVTRALDLVPLVAATMEDGRSSNDGAAKSGETMMEAWKWRNRR